MMTDFSFLREHSLEVFSHILEEWGFGEIVS